MKEFEVEITETLQRTVVIRAGSRAEAEVLAEEMWNNEEFVLGAEDFVGAEFSAVSERKSPPNAEKERMRWSGDKFFIGFAFFEFGALCGFFVAALMQAARDGDERCRKKSSRNHSTL